MWNIAVRHRHGLDLIAAAKAFQMDTARHQQARG